ncbi:MAG: fibronectin type III domain-containing protein [Bacteroidales bacterium]|nr:fibronectin type III domain-containing protein [Bacteroidales bacterium]
MLLLQAYTDSLNIAKLAQHINAMQSSQMPYSIAVNINGNPSEQMAFNWFTNVGVTNGMVQIVEGNATKDVDFATALVVNAQSDSVKNTNYNVSANGLTATAGIPVNSKKSFMSNKALATGLKANTVYSYRVGKPGAWSQIGTFTTASAGKDAFSFVYFTDPQANTSDMFDISQKTTHAAHAMYPNANFWLSCGDLIETSGSTNSEWEYEQFFQTQQDIFMNKPFAAVTGNHDKSANKNFTNHFNYNSPSFDKTMSTTPGSIYSFVYGDALFMALSYEDYSKVGFLDSLALWMNAQVKANPEVKWKIACYHKTMYTGSGSHQSDSDGKAVREKMGPVFDSLKIDWALQGHDHVYEVIGPVNNKQLVANSLKDQTIVPRTVRDNVTGRLGGTFNTENGTLYFLNNSGGRKKYEPRDSVAMKNAETSLGVVDYFNLFTGRFGQTGEPTFSHITVSTDTITVSTYTVNDSATTLFDEYKIIKNLPVTLSISIPDSIKVTAPEVLNLTANAKGSVAKIAFYVNGDFIGEDATSPYSVEWISEEGKAEIVAVATGKNDSICVSKAFVMEIASPYPSAYLVENVQSSCNTSQFEMAVVATDTLIDVIGIDMIVKYDNALYVPSGVIKKHSDLLFENYFDISTYNDFAKGNLSISLSLNASAPVEARFQNIGKLITVEFTKVGDINPSDSVKMAINSLVESYFNGVAYKSVVPGYYTTTRDSIFTGTLQNWADNSTIGYNASDVDMDLITNIFASATDCTIDSTTAIQPNELGVFEYNVNNGTTISIQRDITAGSDVMSVINSADVVLTKKVIASNPSFVPNVYQMIAMDVNMDGVITAGDVSQMNQRIVLKIDEFKQAWNYNAAGVSNGSISKDWLFIDTTTVNVSADFSISTKYPRDDYRGYSKMKVPTVPFCHVLPVDLSVACPQINSELFKGIMLGDVNGNYSIGAESHLKSSSSAIVFDLAQVKTSDKFIDVPVLVYHNSDVEGFEFAAKFDESKLKYETVIDNTTYLDEMFNYNTNDATLRYTATSINAETIEAEKVIAYVRFEKLANSISENDFNGVRALINGESATLEFTTITTSINPETSGATLEVYPSPATDEVYVLVSENSELTLIDENGKAVLTEQAKANEKLTLEVGDLSSATYMLKVVNATFTEMHKVTIIK